MEIARSRIRAGIIPYRCHQGKYSVLLGKEDAHKLTGKSRRKWGPLGGRLDPNESIIEGAIREFSEELMGLISPEDLRGRVKEEDRITFTSRGIETYYYLIDYWDPDLSTKFQERRNKLLPYATQVNQWKIPEIPGREGLFEISRIKWFDLDEIIRIPSQDYIKKFNLKTALAINEICSFFGMPQWRRRRL